MLWELLLRARIRSERMRREPTLEWRLRARKLRERLREFAPLAKRNVFG